MIFHFEKAVELIEIYLHTTLLSYVLKCSTKVQLCPVLAKNSRYPSGSLALVSYRNSRIWLKYNKNHEKPIQKSMIIYIFAE